MNWIIFNKNLFAIMIFLVALSCDQGNKTEEDRVAKYMEKYIQNSIDDVYGYIPVKTIIENIESLKWESDLFTIQEEIYNSTKYRRNTVCNTYMPPLGLPTNIFERSFYDIPQEKYGKEFTESYLSKEEREIADYYFYKESVPNIQKLIKNLESRNFIGKKIFHVCLYRDKRGVTHYRNFVLYKEDNSDSYDIYSLNYDYEMMRKFVKTTLNIDLNSNNIQEIISKYDKIIDNTPLLTNNPVYNKHYNAIQRLSLE